MVWLVVSAAVVRKATISEFTRPLEETVWEKLILRRQLETNAEAICGKMGIQCRYLVKGKCGSGEEAD